MDNSNDKSKGSYIFIIAVIIVLVIIIIIAVSVVVFTDNPARNVFLKYSSKPITEKYSEKYLMKEALPKLKETSTTKNINIIEKNVISDTDIEYKYKESYTVDNDTLINNYTTVLRFSEGPTASILSTKKRTRLDSGRQVIEATYLSDEDFEKMAMPALKAALPETISVKVTRQLKFPNHSKRQFSHTNTYNKNGETLIKSFSTVVRYKATENGIEYVSTDSSQEVKTGSPTQKYTKEQLSAAVVPRIKEYNPRFIGVVIVNVNIIDEKNVKFEFIGTYLDPEPVQKRYNIIAFFVDDGDSVRVRSIRKPSLAE